MMFQVEVVVTNYYTTWIEADSVEEAKDQLAELEVTDDMLTDSEVDDYRIHQIY